MDRTASQQAVDAAQAVVDADNEKTASDQAALDTAKSNLAIVDMINLLETLTADQIPIINEALRESTNTLGLSILLPEQTTS